MSINFIIFLNYFDCCDIMHYDRSDKTDYKSENGIKIGQETAELLIFRDFHHFFQINMIKYAKI